MENLSSLSHSFKSLMKSEMMTSVPILSAKKTCFVKHYLSKLINTGMTSTTIGDKFGIGISILKI
jgi:hypothetical protein